MTAGNLLARYKTIRAALYDLYRDVKSVLDADERIPESGDDDLLQIMWAIEHAMFFERQPLTLADLKSWPADDPESFRRTGLYMMIERDSKEEYRDIEGYLDSVWCSEVDQLFEDPTLDHLNGLGVCEWMERHCKWDDKTERKGPKGKTR